MAAAWENKKIWYIIYVYLHYDDDYHLLTAYYVSVILPSALYTLRYSLLKKLCKVGIIVPVLQSWKQMQVCNLLQVSPLFKPRAIRFYKPMLSWLHPKKSVCVYH